MSDARITPELVQFWVYAAFFALGMLANVAVIIRYFATGRRASLVPLVAGIAGTIAFLLRPELRPWAWVPLLVDPGSGPMVIGALVRGFRNRR